MTPLRQLWADLVTPSTRDETLHYWAAIQGTHAVLGACAFDLVAALVSQNVTYAFILLAAYAIIKEGGDRRRGGGLRDGMADTLFVGLGVFHAYLPSFGILVVLSLAVGVLVKAFLMRRER